jgi:DNA polymerase-3 subunit beta
MHFTAPVGEIAKALDLARLALPQRDLMPALSALHIGAGDNCVTITANILDYAVQASCAAQVESEGATAVPGAAIAGIVSNLAPASELRAHYDGSLLTLMAGRARYKLLTLPIGDLPPAPTIAPIGTLALERAQVIRLLDPAFAADDERTRGYSCTTHPPAWRQWRPMAAYCPVSSSRKAPSNCQRTAR